MNLTSNKLDRKDQLMLLFSSIFMVFVIVAMLNQIRSDQDSNIEFSQISVGENASQSVTFIVGEDANPENPYYTNAKDFFRSNPEYRTEEMITECTSINCINRILINKYNEKSIPFDKINIVVHSNPWSGMNMTINEGGERITAELLSEALEKGEIINTNKNSFKQNSEVQFFACGLGDNKELTKALQRAIVGSDESLPKIETTSTYFNFEKEGQMVKMKEMDVFYAFYPTAYKPADLLLVDQLESKYPEAHINWLQALQNSRAGTFNEPFYYRYNVPVEWEIFYPEFDPPKLLSEADKMEWIMNQDELIRIIDKTEIPFEKFRWIVKKGVKKNSEGLETPYIKVFGKVTVVCILKQSQEQASRV